MIRGLFQPVKEFPCSSQIIQHLLLGEVIVLTFRKAHLHLIIHQILEQLLILFPDFDVGH
jgi:hypothetical protein